MFSSIVSAFLVVDVKYSTSVLRCLRISLYCMVVESDTFSHRPVVFAACDKLVSRAMEI